MRVIVEARDACPDMQTASFTDDYLQIDVRRWQRDGLLRPDTYFAWKWSRDGAVFASINVFVARENVVLSYRYRHGKRDWNDAYCHVRLVRTPCHLGGSRPWFLCSAPSCGRRVAILYGGEHFLCRHCGGLVYACARESPADRAMRRTDKIRGRLGWRPGILNPRGGKPKWMRWKTYNQLRWAHALALDEALEPLLVGLGYGV